MLKNNFWQNSSKIYYGGKHEKEDMRLDERFTLYRGTRKIAPRFGSLAALTQGHWDGYQKFFPHTEVNHMWFEEISLRGFPGKLKNVGRTAAAAETAETDQKQKVT